LRVSISVDGGEFPRLDAATALAPLRGRYFMFRNRSGLQLGTRNATVIAEFADGQ